MRLFSYLISMGNGILISFQAIVNKAMSTYIQNHESNLFAAIVRAPFGYVGIRTENKEINEIVYLPPRFQEKSPTNAIAELAAEQITHYFQQADFVFKLPLKKVGTDFQQRVWKAIAAIPCGEMLTYGQVAKRIGSAPRAVGQACGANWYPLVIPCHRVTAANGWGGFAHHDDDSGFHVGVKRTLLAHEQVMTYSLLEPLPKKQKTLWG